MSVADLVFDIQRIKTAMLRSGLDSLYLANNPRHVVSSQVRLDDMLQVRPGGVVRLKSGVPGEGHVMPLQTENTFPYAQQGMEYMERVVEARVGVSRMFSGIDAAAMSSSNSYDVVGQLSTMAAQRVELIARIFANGVERAFRIAHELLIKSGHSMETMRIRGNWVNVDPTQWRTGRDMTVVAPFAAGNKDSLVQRLMIHAQVHEKALASGLPIVDADNAYNLAVELARATDVSATKLYTDPSTVEPPPPEPDPTMVALEIENKKADNEAADEARKAELEQYKADLNAELERYKVDTNAQLQLILAQSKGETSLSIEQVRAQLRDAHVNKANEINTSVSQVVTKMNESLEKMAQAVAELDKKSSGARKVVRDDKGRVVGVEPA